MMKKHFKKISILMILMLMCVGICFTTVTATQLSFGLEGDVTGCRYWATGARGSTTTDHSSYRYKVGDTYAYCIEAGVAISKGALYSEQGTIEDPRFSWLIYNVTDEQEKQAAIWALAGDVLGNGSKLVAGEGQTTEIMPAEIQAWIDKATAGTANNGQVANAVINATGDKFTYSEDENAYISPAMEIQNSSNNWLSEAPAGSSIRQRWDGLYEIVVPATSVAGDITVTIHADCNTTAEAYAPATIWGDGVHQLVITGGKNLVYGQGTSRSFTIEAVGNYDVIKTDEHGNPVANCKFEITGPYGYHNTIITNENGTATVKGVRVGTYTLTEVEVPVEGNYYIHETNISKTVTVTSGATFEFQSTNYYKRGSAQLYKRDVYEDTDPKGDSILEGAEYTLYAAEDIYEGVEPYRTLLFEANEPITVVTDTGETDKVKTDKDGYTPVIKNVKSKLENKELDGLPIGNYYWKEIKPSKGFNLNDEPINISITNDDPDDVYAADMDLVQKKHLETPIKGRVQVIKMDNNPDSTEESPAKGAILQITLKSDESQFYQAEVDENGFAEFIDEKFHEQHPEEECTIPYGEYTLTEVKESDSGEHFDYYIQAETVVVDVEGETEQRIEMDEPVPMHLQIIKKDLKTNQTVALEGAGFKIYSIADKEFVSLFDPQQDKYIDTFYTGENGYLITPDVLYAGEYIVYEVKAPDGYVLNEEWAAPMEKDENGNIIEDENGNYVIDESRLGEGGKHITVDKQALGIAEDAQYPGLDAGDLIYKVEMGDKPTPVHLKIFKKGLVITDTKQEATEYGDALQPVYTEQVLPGVTFDLYAAEEIKSADGRVHFYNKDEFIESITTDENGIAEIDELPLGKYYVVESDSEDNKVLLDEEKTYFEAEYPGQYVQEVEVNLDKKNTNKQVELKFDKEFQEAPEGEEQEYRYILKDENGNEKPIYAVFGIYTNHDITDYKGKVLINKDQLMDVITVNKGEQVDVKLDLPEGDYYYKELYVTEPYVIDQDRYDFNVTYTEENLPVLDVKGKTVTNYPEVSDIVLLKLSTATVAPASGYGMLTNGDVDPDILSEHSANIYENIRELNLEDFIDYITSDDYEIDSYIKLANATYGVYIDKDCTIPLQRIRLDGTQTEPENTVVTTDENGIFILENIPLEEYWLKELDSPEKHFVSNENVYVDLRQSNEYSILYKVAFDNTIPKIFSKTDVFTGDAVPNCEFRITDESGKEITRMKTDEYGDASVALELFEKGKTYYYEEISAEKPYYYEDGVLYELNTEKHPFVVDYTYDDEGQVVFNEKTEISNYRPSTRELIVRKVDEETGEPLQGCKFSIVLLDENGEPYVNEDGETIYMVKDAVTDENGEYRVENPLYGSYRFIEVEAPEGYDLAEQEMDGYEFTIDDETPDTLIFEVTNTGDIAVVVLASIAVVSVIGIVYVVLRNKKKLA